MLNQGMLNQETIALTIVGLTSGLFLLRFLKLYLAPPLSQLLLNQGHTKYAFWMRKQVPIQKGSCSKCKSC